jgi:decaprenyl-phosphate phosphoribosyltransferase
VSQTVAVVRPSVGAIVRLVRPRSWVKSSVVFLGAASTAYAADAWFWRSTGWAVAAFCVLSSAGYVLNDILDVELDRVHAVKRFRAVAAGSISIPLAAMLSATLAAAGLAMAWALGSAFFLRAAAYLATCAVYSAWLKRVPYVEIAFIAAAFLLRLDAGRVLGAGPPAPLIFAAIGCAIVFLTLSKRMQELTRDGLTSTRDVLGAYDVRHLRMGMVIAGLMAIALFIAYGIAPTPGTILAAQMIFTLPLVIAGFARYLYLMLRTTRADDPTILLLHDRALRYVFLFWVAAVFLSLAVPSLLPLAIRFPGRQP